MELIACVSTVDDDNVTEFVCFDCDDDDMVQMLSAGFTIFCRGLLNTM